jgi:hypothetical protein
MAYVKKGYNPKSLANLNKGMNVPKLMHVDTKTRECANAILAEETEYNGAIMTHREAIIRAIAEKAAGGDLRATRFLFDLVEGNE